VRARLRIRTATRTSSAERGGARLSDEWLIAGLEALDRLPALEESKRRLRVVAVGGEISEVVAAVEADPALAAAVLRAANPGPTEGFVKDLRAAVRIFGPIGITKIVNECPAINFPEAEHGLSSETERFRVHALAVQSLAAVVAQRARRSDSDLIVTAALLHDFGKLALATAFGTYHEELDARATPEVRATRERELFGLDHAERGGLLARRWSLPSALRDPIERHHDARCDGVAAVISVADMLAHYAAGQPVDIGRLATLADRISLDRDSLGALLYELPYPTVSRNAREEPCPLSDRELQIVAAVRDGKVPKQIALELGLSENTIRSHLHRVYARLGVADRAQAVLTASKRGWL
jgi:putative nucleotidyltransferase with HDIG domain